MTIFQAPIGWVSGSIEMRELPAPRSDPFVPFVYGAEPLHERYFYGVAHDLVASRAGLLFLLDWDGHALNEGGTTALLLLLGVSELGWKAEQWDIPGPDHWWTVLSSGLLHNTDGARVELAPTPGFRPAFHTPRASMHRFGLSLFPNSELVVVFQSALYLVGEQIVPDGQNPRVTFEAQTEWYMASRWPPERS